MTTCRWCEEEYDKSTALCQDEFCSLDCECVYLDNPVDLEDIVDAAEADGFAGDSEEVQ